MRRLITVLCALVLAAAIPATASAARPFRQTDHTVSVFCDGMTGTSGTGFAFFGVTISDLFGPDAFVDAWNGSAPTASPDLSRDFDQPVVATWNGTTLAGSIPLLNSTGDPAGTATFSAGLSPVADPISFNDSFKDGNRQVRFSGTSQAFQPTGTLRLPTGTTFDLANCVGDETTVSVTETNPNVYVTRFNQRFVGCDLTNAAGDAGFLFVDLSDNGLFVDAGLFPADGSGERGAFGSGDPSSGTVNLALDVYDPQTGQPTGESGSLAMTVTATGEPFTNLLQNATSKRTTRGQLLDIEGTLTIAGHSFDLGACIGQDSRTKEINTFPRGPKPGGKPPVNDLPSGARLLRPGTSTTVQTKGAAPAAEALFECLTFTDPDTGEVFSVPVGNTVWYKFTGTGLPMTIDTAGSDFDTVAAIYTASGGGYVPVSDGCVDDTPTPPIGRSLQAKVTIPTVAGTTYYVQIGGFPESFPYGNLKVALR